MQLQLDDLGIDYFQQRSAMIDAVTLDDAKRVAKRLLDNGMLVTVVGKPGGRRRRPTRRGPGGLEPAGRSPWPDRLRAREFRITLSGN